MHKWVLAGNLINASLVPILESGNDINFTCVSTLIALNGLFISLYLALALYLTHAFHIVS